MTSRKVFIQLIAIAVCFAFSPFAKAVSFVLIDLGSVGEDYSVGMGVNEQGHVVGYRNVSGVIHAVLWNDSGATDLGTIGGNYSHATDINDHGDVVGVTNIDNAGNSHPFLWNEVSGMQDIGTLGGALGTLGGVARAINNRGQVVGESFPSGSVYQHAFLWDSSTGMQDLGTLPGRVWSYATSINDLGQVVGYSYGGGEHHAFLWESGIFTDLGTLGGSISQAFDINNSGQIVGNSFPTGSSGPTHAFLWEPVTGMINIGTLSGETKADAINDAGQIVGYSTASDDIRRAFLWENGTGLLDLNDLVTNAPGWELNRALDISNQGHIVGIGTYDGRTRAFLLTPMLVSEPTTITLLLIGALGVLAIRIDRFSEGKIKDKGVRLDLKK